MRTHLPPQPLPPINPYVVPARPEPGGHERVAIWAIIGLCLIGIWTVIINVVWGWLS